MCVNGSFDLVILDYIKHRLYSKAHKLMPIVLAWLDMNITNFEVNSRLTKLRNQLEKPFRHCATFCI